MRDSFIFYKSYYDAISHLDKDMQLKAYKMIHEYAFNGVVPDENADGVSKMVFTFVKPTIDSSNEKYSKALKAGKLGGRPRKISENFEQILNECQTNCKTQKAENLNDNYNYNDNVYVNVNDNVYDNENAKESAGSSADTNSDALTLKDDTFSMCKEENVLSYDNTDSLSESNNNISGKNTIQKVLSSYTNDKETLLLLNDWLNVRRAKRMTSTASTIRINLENLEGVARESGLSVNEYLREIIKRSWGAFYVIKDNHFLNERKTKSSTLFDTETRLDFNLEDIYETPDTIDCS